MANIHFIGGEKGGVGRGCAHEFLQVTKADAMRGDAMCPPFHRQFADKPLKPCLRRGIGGATRVGMHGIDG